MADKYNEEDIRDFARVFMGSNPVAQFSSHTKISLYGIANFTYEFNMHMYDECLRTWCAGHTNFLPDINYSLICRPRELSILFEEDYDQLPLLVSLDCHTCSEKHRNNLGTTGIQGTTGIRGEKLKCPCLFLVKWRLDRGK